MTKTEALRLALEAFEYIENNYMSLPAPATKAITAIKEALAQPEYQSTADKSKLEKVPAKGTLLAQPEQEPVWIQPNHLQKARQAPFLCRVEPKQRDDFVPLYTTPPQRKPLEGVIDVRPIGYHSLQLIFRSQTDIAEFKAAHGIKE